MDILQMLYDLQDKEYAAFQAKVTPEVERDTIIGVRIPELRKLAKKLAKTKEGIDFLDHLPHNFYDENMLHSLILSELKDYEDCVKRVEAFLPYVNNWAVNDTLSPAVFKKHKEALMERILCWTASKDTYTCRFGILMLMRHFLDGDFKASYLEIPALVSSEEYYVKMMQAWFYATALSKHWQETIPYLTDEKLSVWVHNKTIQKARESYRITDEQKVYLKSLKR